MKFLFVLISLGVGFAVAPACADATSETIAVYYFAKNPERERLGHVYANRLSDSNTIEDILAQLNTEIPLDTALAIGGKTPTGFHVMIGRQGADLPSLYFFKSETGTVDAYQLGDNADVMFKILSGIDTQSTHTLNFIAPARLLAADVTQEEMAVLLAHAQRLLNDFANE